MSTTNPNNSPPAATTTSEYRLNVHAAGKTYSLDFQHAWHRWVGPRCVWGSPAALRPQRGQTRQPRPEAWGSRSRDAAPRPSGP